MTDDKHDQVKQWLKKLEQESWQLELLVSAFTIFLLIQAGSAFDTYLEGVVFEYNVNQSLLTFIFFFLVLLGLSVKALVVFLIVHLLLRGFWIGTIGLRSVQADVDFSKFNYSEFFTDKLKKKVISLDNLVIMLDEICSIIFSFAFLVISMLLAFGLHLLFLGTVLVSLGSIANMTNGVFSVIMTAVTAITAFFIILTGFIYFIDYFSLGFFKKFKWVSKVYYPIYRFYGFITLAVISRSIYYYLIGKFSKKRIRIVYLVVGLLMGFVYLTEYDQYQYFTTKSDTLALSSNQYDNLRPSDEHISGASIPSNQISGPFMQLFLRYDPRDNKKIQSNCPDFEPIKKPGLNWRFSIKATDNGFSLSNKDFDEEDKQQLLSCMSSLYEISINDSVYHNVTYYFFTHSTKNQKGLITMLPTASFRIGENVLKIQQVSHSASGEKVVEPFTRIPFWFE